MNVSTSTPVTPTFARPVFNETPTEGNYRQYGTAFPFPRLAADRSTYAYRILGEAHALDVLVDAHRANRDYDHAAALAMNTAHEWPSGNLVLSIIDDAPAAPSPAERDNEAALRQAELLGASADQRRKLRTMVEERVAAQREVERLQTALAESQAATLQARHDANADVTDPNDKRVWGIFGAAAAEANIQGYCSVYDQISTAVGIPNREELGAQDYLPKRTYDVQVRIEFESQYITVTVVADSENGATDEINNMDTGDLVEYLADYGTPEISSYDVLEVTLADD